MLKWICLVQTHVVQRSTAVSQQYNNIQTRQPIGSYYWPFIFWGDIGEFYRIVLTKGAKAMSLVTIQTSFYRVFGYGEVKRAEINGIKGRNRLKITCNKN